MGVGAHLGRLDSDWARDGARTRQTDKKADPRVRQIS